MLGTAADALAGARRWRWPSSPACWTASRSRAASSGCSGASLVFGLVDALLGPILRLLTLPLTVITLGLFTLVVNTVLLFVASGISNALSVGGFFATMLAALLVTVVSTVLGWVLRPGATGDPCSADTESDLQRPARAVQGR